MATDRTESEKERTDRQLIELLNELRVALPGAQVLLAFLFTVPFATRFGRITHIQRVAFFVCLLCTVAGTVLLMAPSVYHRLRWEQGDKADVIRVAHRLFLAGTAFLALGIVAAVFMVDDVLYGTAAAIASTAVTALAVLLIWYALPLARQRRSSTRRRE
jgi:hypothetical protein